MKKFYCESRIICEKLFYANCVTINWINDARKSSSQSFNTKFNLNLLYFNHQMSKRNDSDIFWVGTNLDSDGYESHMVACSSPLLIIQMSYKVDSLFHSLHRNDNTLCWITIPVKFYGNQNVQNGTSSWMRSWSCASYNQSTFKYALREVIISKLHNYAWRDIKNKWFNENIWKKTSQISKVGTHPFGKRIKKTS